jgi:hypothetical protein
LVEARGGAGKPIDMDINDPRYPREEWNKMQHIHESPIGDKKENINIHYWENIQTKERHGFKFKDK